MRDPWSPPRGPVEDLLGAARRALRDVPGFGAERERELVENILSQTTRGVAQVRPSRTRWLPFAAAAAVVGAGALALLPRGAPDSAVLVAAVLPADAAPAPHELFQRVERESSLTSARDELVATAAAAGRTPPLAGVGQDAPLGLRLLEARARGLRERRWDPWLREVALSELDTLSLALWCEVELDRYVLSGSRPPAWKRAVEILERDLARAETPKEGSKLLTHALDRAREYGLAAGITVARLDPGARLWSEKWFDDLDAAGREAGIAETGVWRAWVDWRGQ